MLPVAIAHRDLCNNEVDIAVVIVVKNYKNLGSSPATPAHRHKRIHRLLIGPACQLCFG